VVDVNEPTLISESCIGMLVLVRPEKQQNFEATCLMFYQESILQTAQLSVDKQIVPAKLIVILDAIRSLLSRYEHPDRMMIDGGPFQAKDVEEWLRNSEDTALTLYWSRARPRK
jgi:hypothetical protein